MSVFAPGQKHDALLFPVPWFLCRASRSCRKRRRQTERKGRKGQKKNKNKAFETNFRDTHTLSASSNPLGTRVPLTNPMSTLHEKQDRKRTDEERREREWRENGVR